MSTIVLYMLLLVDEIVCAAVRRLPFGCFFIYKSQLGLFPSYLSVFMCKTCCQDALSSHNILQVFISRVRMELEKMLLDTLHCFLE